MIGNKDTDVFKFEFGHNRLNIFYRNRINTSKGLI